MKRCNRDRLRRKAYTKHVPGFLPAGKEYISSSRARVKPRPRPRNRRRRVKAPAVCLSRQGSGGGGEAKRDTQPHHNGRGQERHATTPQRAVYIRARRNPTGRRRTRPDAQTKTTGPQGRKEPEGGGGQSDQKSGITPPTPFYARGRAGTY